MNERKIDTDSPIPISADEAIRLPAQVTRSIGYAVRRAQMRVYEGFFAALTDLDTTPTRYTLMLLIRENPGIRSVDLARLLGVARSRMVKLIDDLESRNLISRETPRSDRRNRVLVLTPQGARKLNQLEQVAARYETRLTEDLGAEDRERLLGLLWRIALPL